MLQTLAHQGGWDETLFVVVPIGIFAALLLRAKRRAEAEAEAETADAPADAPAPPATDLDR
jgi:hypothetical protein